MRRHAFPVLLCALLIGAGCSGPTTPAPSTPAPSTHFAPIPAPQAIYSLNGRVIEEGTRAGIEGATVFIVDGGHEKAVATTNAAGNYSATVFSPSRATFVASAPNSPGATPCAPDAPCFMPQVKDIDLTTTNTLSFELHHPVCEAYECF